MLQHGNHVRIDTSRCPIPDCVNGCASWHKSFNGALGKFHGDVREIHRDHPPDCEYKHKRNRLCCLECKTPTGMTIEQFLETHHMLVIFGDSHDEVATFTTSEMEDLGSDYIDRVFNAQLSLLGVFEDVPVTHASPH